MQETPNQGSRPFRVFHLLQRAHGALFRAADKVLRRRAGITAAQHGVLLVLSAGDGVPITTIAEQLKMGKSSLTGLVDRMSEKGWVRREIGAEDGRMKRVFLEPNGREILHRTKDLVRRHNERLLDPFSASEQKTIERFLRHVAGRADDIVDDRAFEPIPETDQ